MITSIRLRNWKSHLDSELTFSKGVNALIGIMGSGKTSVMQAIAFALFGTFSGVSSRKLSLDDLIMTKPQGKDSASVELEFVLDGRKYEVKRTLVKGKGTASSEIREDGKLLEVNPQGVTREVSRILQMDYDLFQRAVYSEQNALDYFLQIPKGKRMQQIDSMLKLDRYEKAREAGVSIRNKISERREEKLRIIDDMKGRKFEERIGKLREEIAGKEKEKEGIERDHVKFRARIESLEKEFEKKTGGIEGTREKVADLNAKIRSLENENKGIRESIGEKEKVREKIKGIRKSLGKNPEDSLKEEERDLEGKRKEFYSLETLKSETSRSMEELQGAGRKCPVCESEITGERKSELMNHKKKHMTDIGKSMEALSGNISGKEKEIGELKDKIALLKEMESEAKGMEDEIDKMESNRKDMEAGRKEVERLVKEIRKEETEEKGLRKDLQELVAGERELKTKMESLKEIIEDRNEMLKELEKEMGVYLKYVEEARTYGMVIESMGSFVSVLRKTQDQLRDEFLKTVNYIMNHVWNELYPYGDFSDIRILVEKDYVLQLKGTKGWVNADLVSGGERSLASLALRIAFSLAFTPNLRWLILDEPTHNLDVNAIEHFGGVLRDRMENIIDQVFLITHEERLSDYITGSVYKLERDKETDGSTKIAGG